MQAFATIRRVWTGIATRIGVRKRGHMKKLRKDVRSCEYEDVRVMWEMLSRNEAQTIGIGSPRPRKRSCKCKKTTLWNCLEWARPPPFPCPSF